MTTVWVELHGSAAGVLTTFSAAPQLITTYRSRDVKSFDLWLPLVWMKLREAAANKSAKADLFSR